MKLELLKNSVIASTNGIKKAFAFPAAAISIKGRRIEAKNQIGPVKKTAKGGLSAVFDEGEIRFKVSVFPGGAGWFFKQVEITASKELPTPDYVEVDFQKTTAPGLKRRGYMGSLFIEKPELGEEEGAGVLSGCGYPLFGDDMFTGLEHPAAFNTVLSSKGDKASWNLRHFPTWQGKSIKSPRAVIGMGRQLRDLFFDYLATIRRPVMKEPLIIFCTFWSDPYIGSSEYKTTLEGYEKYIEAFSKLGLRPDVYMLDAGWQDRRSFFRAKRSYGGEKALRRIGEKAREVGSDLSLWVSTNGPVGMDMDYLRKQGVKIGGGPSSHYSGNGYALMTDERLDKELTERFLRLASPEYGVRLFKVDWDNECAGVENDPKYPTINHVREASMNMMARLDKEELKVNPRALTRNGRWPSPWHLTYSSHVSLPDGGDCEYSLLPSLSQRDAASTHRDILYWCVHQRDQSVFPLDVYDNHEFGHSFRNPFQEEPGSWSNACVWAIMRGTSYHQFTLLPEALEDWQVKILGRVFEVIRTHAADIITDRSQMLGGSPGKGEVYGFLHERKGHGLVLALRNASALPQEYKLPACAPKYQQYYPCCRTFKAGETVVFGPHEVKVLSSKMLKLPEKECQLMPSGKGKYECFLPASKRADVVKFQQIPELKIIHNEVKTSDDSLQIFFGMQVPYRMRNFKMLLRIFGKGYENAKVRLLTSRYSSCGGSAYGVPVEEVPYGMPGHGERKNPDARSQRDSRYFAADIPQGGEVFCRLTISGANIKPEELELWAAGFEAPARSKEEGFTMQEKGLCLPYPHPDGFPRNVRIR